MKKVIIGIKNCESNSFRLRQISNCKMNVQGLWDLFDNPSDDDDILPPERQFHPKIPNYFETVMTYSLTGKRIINFALSQFYYLQLFMNVFLI